jgi:MFS family permease
VSYRTVLRVREFRALLVADGLSTLGDQVARIAVALLVLERSGSAFAASATYACSYLTWLVGGPLLSALPDHYPRRRLMIGCDLARMALVACLAIPGVSLWVVFAVLALVGLMSPPAEAARSALLADVLDGEEYVVGTALSGAVGQAGQVGGFVAGGALVALLGVQAALLLDAATFAVSALLLLAGVRERVVTRGEGAEHGSALQEAAAGFQLVLRSARLRALLCWGLLSAGTGIAAEGLAVSISDRYGGGALWAGILTAAIPAGFLIGSYVVLRVPAEGRERLFPALVVLSCVPLLATPLVEDLRVLTVLWVLAGCGGALQVVANAAYVQAVPAHLRGRAFGVAGTTMMVLQGALLLGAGALAELTGPRWPIAVLAGLCLLVVPLLPRGAPEPVILSRSTEG